MISLHVHLTICNSQWLRPLQMNNEPSGMLQTIISGCNRQGSTLPSRNSCHYSFLSVLAPRLCLCPWWPGESGRVDSWIISRGWYRVSPDHHTASPQRQQGAGIAQWLERRTRDWKVAGSNPCRSDGRIFFSRVDYLCWLFFRYPFHPRVTAVARKRSRSFCQKCRWQVTVKHTYTLCMWLCM